MKIINSLCAALVFFLPVAGFAGTDGSISGTVLDSQGVGVPQTQVQLLSTSGSVIKESTSSNTGEYRFFPVTFGDYQISIKAKGYAPYQATVHVSSGGNTQADITLSHEAKEMVLNVQAKKHGIKNSTSVSSIDITKEDIAERPQGENIKLPKLLSTTVPGVVQGPFGQSFIRGNHANIQYQIDGVQLPDSPSNTFGDAFTPRNIDHMEVITGGVPAEYGERLAAVVNIVTKSGSETPNGEVELNYGSYNTTSPFAVYSGSNGSADIHYFLSAGYLNTNRGLDTPQPQSESNNSQGGTDAIHDWATGSNQFAKIDWLIDNSNKLSLIAFNSYNFLQIPNFPSSFGSQDQFFALPNQYGSNPVNWVPANTDDTQQEINAYLQTVWKHTFSENEFLQSALYYKYSYIGVKNDLNNDLMAGNLGPNQIDGSSPSSFTESRATGNLGLKEDYTNRINESHLFKTGFQVQASQAVGGISVTAIQGGATTVKGVQPIFQTAVDNSPNTGYFESVYAQDDYSLFKNLIFNLGLRFDATQFSFAGISPTDSLLQPRVGINYLPTETTKIHIFYGKLFQPAPVENLRDTFNAFSGGTAPYDIKAEKDDYYEAGIAQQIGDHVISINTYYKNAISMLDDFQLFNTSIAQPYNFAIGFAYGTELSIKGNISSHWSDYLNYSYEIAKGNGLGGGAFTGQTASDWAYLDHVQISTANLGVTYKESKYWGTIQAVYGSGLRTGQSASGQGNVYSLPEHLTFDVSLGYEFQGESWWEKFKLSGDVLNITNNVYPITIANGYNGSHYAAGIQYFVHLSKEL